MIKVITTLVLILMSVVASARSLDGYHSNYTFDSTFSNIGLSNVDKAIINWKDFNIAAGESVNFSQKDANSVVLNRVNSNLPTEIYGNLTANGKVFVMNGNGVLIGRGASVNVGSFLATTGSISDEEFYNNDTGAYNFLGATKSVINQGLITTSGYTILLGKSVINEGVIDAKGDVVLASGDSFLFISNTDPISVEIKKSSIDSYITNTGNIAGRNVSMLSERDLYNNAVNHSGVIKATAIDNVGGKVYLSGGNIHIASSASIEGDNLDMEANSSIISNADITKVKNINATSTDSFIDISNIGITDTLKVDAKNGDVKLQSDGDISVTESNSKSIYINSDGGVKGDKINAANLNIIAQGDVDVSASSSVINVESRSGTVDITNISAKDTHIEKLISLNQVINYTQAGGKLTFSEDISAGTANINLKNIHGSIETTFDFVNGLKTLLLDANYIHLTNVGAIDLSGEVVNRLVAKEFSLISDTGDININMPSLFTTVKFRTISAANGKVNINIAKGVNVDKLLSMGSVTAETSAGVYIKSLETNSDTILQTGDNSKIDVTVNNLYQTKFFIKNGRNSGLKISGNKDIEIVEWLLSGFKDVSLASKDKVIVPDLNFGIDRSDLTFVAKSFEVADGSRMSFYADKLTFNLEFGIDADINANEICLKGGNFKLNLLNDSASEFKALGLNKYSIDVKNLAITTNFDVKFSGNVNLANLNLTSKSFNLNKIDMNAGTMTLVVAEGIRLDGKVSTASFTSESNSFEFFGGKTILAAGYINLNVLPRGDVAVQTTSNNEMVGEIFGEGRIVSSGLLSLSADKIGVNGVLIVIGQKDNTFLTARNVNGLSIDIVAESWLYGMRNYNTNTLGNVLINGENASPEIAQLFSQLDDKGFLPAEDTNMFVVNDYTQIGSIKPFPNDLIIVENFKINEAKYIYNKKGRIELR